MEPVRIHVLGRAAAAQADIDESGGDAGCCGVESVVDIGQVSDCCDAAGGAGCGDEVVAVVVQVK